MNTILIIGAGPSESSVDYENLPETLDTFGMNMMCQFYAKMKWWPTYFGCFDRRVTQSQTTRFKAMIEDPDCQIRRFYLLSKISDSPKVTVLKPRGKVGDFGMSFPKMGYGGCTGVNCAQVAAILGYTRILLVGMDGYATEQVDGAVKDGNYLKIAHPAKTNPNYSRLGYQPDGLEYNPPNEAKFHRPAWKSFAKFALKNNIEVVNCSWGNVADFFPRSTLMDEMEAMRK